jgi:FtsP/CotA-like multicopper oxidase with cupredoxin domain
VIIGSTLDLPVGDRPVIRRKSVTTLRRRSLLKAGLVLAASGIVAACSEDDADPAVRFVAPDGNEVNDAEARRKPGALREMSLQPTIGEIDLGGVVVSTWTYGGTLPGTAVRIRAGDQISATVHNGLPTDTSVHWHGVRLRNDADGVPHLTQAPIASGTTYTYRFAVPDPGTYWFHPHVGAQLDRGLYAPLIVEDPAEPGQYDDEWIIVLDDWLDGIKETPEDVLARLREGMHAGGGHMMGTSSALLGGDAGDVQYPHYLLNGRVPAAPVAFQARAGDRIRIRLINAGGDTAFRVGIGGHSMRVTHADGFPVEPVSTDAILIGMGERYDVLVDLADGVFPLVALAEGKDAAAFALVRTGSGTAPTAAARPPELNRRIAAYRQLMPAEPVRLPGRDPDRLIKLELTGGMMAYDWGFNGRPHHPDHFEAVRSGERVRLEFENTTMMWHPVHLHGHTFALERTGLRKDTAIVLPGQKLAVDFDADNPGRWMIHCHNIYHAESGMMTQLGYVR